MDIYEKCYCCDKNAVWYYMPGGSAEHPYYCEDHVPRGCTCNENHVKEGYKPLPDPEWIEGYDFVWTVPNEVWETLDGEKRVSPCCEFDYSSDFYRKRFGESDMCEQISLFTKSKMRNRFIENEFITLYVRNATRMFEGQMLKCLDLGQIKINDESLYNHGIFTEFIDSLVTTDFYIPKGLPVYVECIHNPAVTHVLKKFNFKFMSQDELEINMYLLR